MNSRTQPMPVQQAETPPADLSELQPSQVIKPERFTLEEVAGITVPILCNKNNKVVTDWRLMLQWSDGHREQRSLPEETLSVGGKTLFFSHRPGAPPQDHWPTPWTQEGRRKWLEGSQACDPVATFQDLLLAFRDYVHLPPETAGGTVTTLACWVILSYCYDLFDSIPYLAIGGPAGSGKSRVFELLSQIVFRPLSSSNLSSPSLFRSIESYGGVVLLDEAEQLRECRSSNAQELLPCLLAGYKKGGCVNRCKTDKNGDYEPTSFNVFGPKALASINSLPPPLASRCIQVPMLRAPKDCPQSRKRVSQDAERFQKIRDSLHALSLTFAHELRVLPTRQDVCPSMSGRNFELWQPLLAIADWLEGHGCESALEILQEHSLRTVADSQEAATPPEDELLLELLAAADRGLTATDLLTMAKSRELSMFRNSSARDVAERLKRYGLKSRSSNGRKIFRPTNGDLLRIQETYGVDLGQQCSTPGTDDVRVTGYEGYDRVHSEGGKSCIST